MDTQSEGEDDDDDDDDDYDDYDDEGLLVHNGRYLVKILYFIVVLISITTETRNASDSWDF